MQSLLPQKKKIKSVNPEYINYLDSIKYPVHENAAFRTLLNKTGLSTGNIIEVLKAHFFVCLFGLILKIIIPMDIKTFGKKSFITGIPFLRGTFFLPPFVLLIALIVLSLGPYYNNKINEKYVFTKYMQKLNFFYFPSILLKLIIFYIIYYILIFAVNNHYSFKISGHFLISVISSSMLTNIMNVSDGFVNQDIKKKNFSILGRLCNFFIYHNLYTLIFTSWIYHSFPECILSLAIATFYILFIEAINFDQIVSILLIPKLYNSKKTKVFIEFYY